MLKYPSFDAALASAEWLVATDPGSVETIDETVLGLARGDVIYDQVRVFLVDGGGRRRARSTWSSTAATNGPREAKVAALLAEIAPAPGQPGAPHGYELTWKASERESLWNLRKKGVGLLGNAPGARKPVPFVEDTVVPPENLQAYVREFRALLDAEGLRYGMFGHVDVGCLHVRPALDLKDPEDEARVPQDHRRASTALVHALRRLASGASTAKVFAQSSCRTTSARSCIPELQRIKALFDPRNQLNPGKIATPAGARSAWRASTAPRAARSIAKSRAQT